MKRIFTLLGIGFLSITSFSQGALNFDGINDQVELGNSMNTILDPLNTITVEALVKPSTTTGFGIVIGNYNTPANNNQMQFLVRRDADQYVFYVDDGTGYDFVATGSGTVVIDTWQHIAGVWDGSELRIYLDGVLTNTTTGINGTSFATTTNPIRMGNNNMGEIYTGDIDEVRIWSSVRTETEILENMNCSVTTDLTGLIAAYNFNEGIANTDNSAISTVYDYTNSGYNGTLQGFTLTGVSSNFSPDSRSNFLAMDGAIGSSSVSDRISSPIAGDFNNDGFQDLLVTTGLAELRLYLNDGAANFDTYSVIASGAFSIPAIGDVDADGDLDIVFRPSSYAVVYINNGLGVFSDLGVSLQNGDGSTSVAKIIDVNGDGKTDLVLGTDNSGLIDESEIWLNTGTTGNPAFTFSTSLTNPGGAVNSIAIGDVDDDGDIDIALGAGSWNGKYFLNNNDGTWSEQADFSGYCGGVRLIDWDQNGTLDLVNVDNYNNWGVQVRYNDGDGNFDATPTLVIAGQPGLFGNAAFSDLNADGFLDVVSTNWGGYAQVFISNGCALTQESGCAYRLGRADNGVVTADFDNNGKPDVFCGARDTKSTFAMNYLDDVTTPALPVITSTTDDVVCDGEDATISFVATGATETNWYSDATLTNLVETNSSYSVTTPAIGTTTYYAQTENANGCVSAVKEVEVLVNENPEAALNATSNTSLDCNGDNNGDLQIDVTLNGTATSAIFDWDNDGTGDNDDSEDLTNLESGIYNLELIDNNGCAVTLQSEVTEPNILSSTESVTVEAFGNDGAVNITVTGGTAPYTYDWSGANGFTSATEDLTNIIAGTYNLEVTDDNGCTYNTQVIVATTVAINENNDLGVSIYPNPNNGEFTISTTENNASINIYSTDGKMIINNLRVTEVNQLINLGDIESGIYFVKVTNDNNQKTIRLIIE